eukprot:9497974-Pyramimonas_sp.AAC.1
MPAGAAASAPGTPRAATGAPSPRASGSAAAADGGGDPLAQPGADPWAKRPRTADGGPERAAGSQDPMDAVQAAIAASQDFLTKQLDAKLAAIKSEVIADFGEQLKGPLAAVVSQQATQNAQFRGEITELQSTSQRLEDSNKQI